MSTTRLSLLLNPHPEIVASVQTALTDGGSNQYDLVTSWPSYANLCGAGIGGYPDCVVCTYGGEFAYIANAVAGLKGDVSTVAGDDFAACATMIETGEVYNHHP